MEELYPKVPSYFPQKRKTFFTYFGDFQVEYYIEECTYKSSLQDTIEC
jgi:hypothetical protein